MSDLNIYYECRRCKYSCNQLIDLKRHLKRKNKCLWKEGTTENLSEIEIYNESIQPKYKNLENICKKYFENKEKQQNNEVDWKEFKLKCDYCYKKLANRSNLERHIATCKTKNIINKISDKNNTNNTNNTNNINNTNMDNKNINTINNNNISNNIINNTTNNNIYNITNNINQNITQNITINIDHNCVNKILIPFYEKFDTSHITDEIKFDLLLSSLYEDTLKEILKNELNLNFLIEDSIDNKSIIYHDNKLNRINKDELYEIVWEKIKNYLIESLEYIQKIKTKYDKDMLKFLEKKILIKHTYLKNRDKNIQSEVKNIINRCSQENKDKILIGFEKIENKNNLIENILNEKI